MNTRENCQSLLQSAHSHGFIASRVWDIEDDLAVSTIPRQIIDAILSVDICWVRFTNCHQSFTILVVNDNDGIECWADAMAQTAELLNVFDRILGDIEDDS